MTMSIQRKFLLPMMCLAMPTAAIAQVQMFPTMESIRETVPDRVEVVAFMLDSSMHFFDMNNDGGISDTDVAFMVEDRLMELYGPDLNIPDLDGDGALTGEDMVAAITTILASSFGDIDGTGETVTGDDVMAAGSNLNAGSPNADVNFDGTADLIDVLEVDNQIGNQVNEWDIETAARSIFAYIGFIREQGRAYFIPEEAPDKDHLQGISGTWPDNFPRWWRSNHQTGVSLSYDPHRLPYNHGSAITRQYPSNPSQPHDKNLSKQWPANHYWHTSLSWPVEGDPPQLSHETQVSGTWPAGHSYEDSRWWDENLNPHDLLVSRSWWPQHTASDSSTRIIPPLHREHVSHYWVHDTQLSQNTWPPNHSSLVSDGWGPGHSMRQSSAYPPNHVVTASATWPGPQISWPPSHTLTVSATWGEPVPGPWPLFPPNHTWFTTFRDIVTPVVPRVPWSSAP